MERIREFQRRYQGPEGLFFIRRINHPAGSVIALLLLPTGASPNQVSVAGLVVHLIGALIVALLPVPAPLLSMLLVLLIWQVAFSLDCADGQLARAKGQASAFGAWLDQVIDVVAHSMVNIVLCLYVIRALGFDPTSAATFISFVVWINLFQLFATWQRGSVLGSKPAVGSSPPEWVTLLLNGRHLLDYGAYLFVGSLLLLSPLGLFLFLVFMSVANAGAVVAQLSLNWYRHLQEARGQH